MADVYKPSQPMNKEGDFFFPRTTVDQVYIDPPTGKMLDAKITEMDEATAAAAAAADSAQTAADNAQTTADSANTTAGAAMPQSGGVFTGTVSVNIGNHSDTSLYNMDVWEADGSTKVSTARIKFCRK